MNMKVHKIGMTMLAVTGFGFGLAAQQIEAVEQNGKRMITLVEDRDQDYMYTKVYELKHIKSADIMPFVRGAVIRANDESEVNRLSYAPGGKEFLVVSMPDYMIDDIDDMLAKLDRPGTRDADGSLIQGTGIYRYVYCPEHRAGNDMLAAIQGTVVSPDGASFFDVSTSMFYWKDSKSDGDFTMEWLKALDRPVPQMELTIRVYELNESDVKELGIDYISWKNGPGLNLFGAGLDFMSMSAHEEVLDAMYQTFDIASNANWAWGGIFVAPQFDASFLRMLAQKGNAKIHSSASLTVVNDFNGSYTVSFSPDFQNITKDANQQLAVVSGTSPGFAFTVDNPIICFNSTGERAANILLSYQLAMNSTVERNNAGVENVTFSDFSSFLTLAAGTEKLLGTFDREHLIDQDHSMPLLGDIPGMKYLFGTSTKSDGFSRMYVTVEAQSVNPESDLSDWAGKVITAAEMIKTADTE